MCVYTVNTKPSSIPFLSFTPLYFSHRVASTSLPIFFTLTVPTPVKRGNDQVEQEVNDNRGTGAVGANNREPGIDAVAEKQ